MRNVVAVLAASLVVLLGACASEAERLATADIEPKVRVVSTAGEGTEVTVVLFQGSLPFATYRLQSGERLTVTPPGGEAVEMTPGTDMSAWLRRNAYVATLPETRPGDELVIAFERADEDDAPNTLVRVPGEITVTRPSPGDERTFDESFSVAWEPLGSGQVELRFAVGDCAGLAEEELEELRAERGFVGFPFGAPLSSGETGLATVTFSAPTAAERCEADLLVGRTSDAIALDPAFGELRDDSRSVRVSTVVPLVISQAPTLATADIEPKVRVVSTAGHGTEVTVVLFRAGLLPGGTYELAIGERLTVTAAGGEPVVLRPGSDMSAAAQNDAYLASLPELLPGDELVIALEREGEEAAPSTVVRVPGEIDVIMPVPGDLRTLGESFTIEWEPFTSGQVELRFAVDTCEGLDEDPLDDLRTTRGYPLALRNGDAGTTTVTFSAPSEAERCEAELLVGRVSDTITPDPAFRGLRGASRAVRVSEPLALVFDQAP